MVNVNYDAYPDGYNFRVGTTVYKIDKKERTVTKQHFLSFLVWLINKVVVFVFGGDEYNCDENYWKKYD